MNLLKKINIKRIHIVLRSDMLLPAIYGTLVLALLWTPMDEWLSQKAGISWFTALTGEQIHHFSRQVGQALVNGIDISKRIANMSFFAFLYVPILFFLWWAFLSLLFRKKEVSDEGYAFFRSVAFASLPAVAVTVFFRLDFSVFTMLSPVAYLAVFYTLLYLRFGDRAISPEGFKWAFFTAIPVTVLSIFWLNLIKPELMRSTLSALLLEGAVYTVVMLFFCLCAAAVSNQPYANTFYTSHTPLFVAPILTAILLETIQVLNQYGIFVTNKLFLCVLPFLLCAAFGRTWYLAHAKKKPERSWDYRRAQYLLLVLGLVLLLLRPYMQTSAWNELFETSNAGSDVYAFLVDGEIPLIENLNAHMILEDLGYILYGWLNNDALGAVWYGYPIVSMAAYLVLYWILKELAGRECACLTMLFFPVDVIMSWLFPFTFGLIPIASAVYAARKDTKASFACFIVSCILSCLYRADIGISCGVAALLVLTVHLMLQKKYKGMRALWLTGVLFGAGCVILFFALCLYRGISPLARILEAVSILGDADVMWSYANVSASYGFAFFFSYLIMPTAGILCGIIIIIRWNQGKASLGAMLVVLILAIAQVFEFGRGIVRHSMLEGCFAFQLGLCSLAVIISVWVFIGEQKRQLPLFLSVAFIIQLITVGEIKPNNSLIQEVINRQLSVVEAQVYEEVMDRVVIPAEITEYSEQLSILFNQTMTPEQSFTDYSYQTTLYALTNRNKPVYTNQSPSELNHEFDHLMFIREVQEIDCPYAVSMTNGVGWDGIDSDMAHYLVAEYLYSNYRPVCTIGPYCIWVRNEEFDNRKTQIVALADSGAIAATLVDENADTFYRRYNLGTVPYLWGTYDRAETQELLGTLEQVETSALLGPYLTATDDATVVEYVVGEDWMPEQYSAPRVAVWCDVNGQDDIIWYDLALNGLHQFEIVVSTANHLSQIGTYRFHLYCSTEEDPNLFLGEVTANLPSALNEYNYTLPINELDRKDGNYIELFTNAVRDGQVQIDLLSKDGKALCSVDFTVYQGQNRYLIRISANQMWHTNAPTALRLQTDVEASDVQVHVLRGDVDYGSMNFLQRMVLRRELHLNA